MKNKFLKLIKNSARGLTLSELLAVVTVMGVLTSIAVPRYNILLERFKAQEQVSLLMTIYEAQKARYLEKGKYAQGSISNINEYWEPTSPSKFFNAPTLGCGFASTCEFSEYLVDCSPANGGTGISEPYLVEVKRSVTSGSSFDYRIRVLEDGRTVCKTNYSPNTCSGICTKLGFQTF